MIERVSNLVERQFQFSFDTHEVPNASRPRICNLKRGHKAIVPLRQRVPKGARGRGLQRLSSLRLEPKVRHFKSYSFDSPLPRPKEGSTRVLGLPAESGYETPNLVTPSKVNSPQTSKSEAEGHNPIPNFQSGSKTNLNPNFDQLF